MTDKRGLLRDFRSANLLKRHKARSVTSFNVLAAIGGAVVLVGAFLVASYALNYIDVWNQQQRAAATVEMRPSSWQTVGAASYEIQNGSVVFNGPDYIYIEIPCGSLVSTIRFSMFVDHAELANLQLHFISKEMGSIGAPLIRDIDGTVQKTVEISSNTRQGAGLIRALIYSPQQKAKVVVFRDPFIECRPID